jgi:hypothetical protein
MATKDVAITKLNTIYNDLNASDRMTTVLRDTSLGLLSILVADQDIPVDTDIIRSFEKINTRL